MEKTYRFKDGRFLLIEYDAGHISPEDNQKLISEMKNVDFSQDLILYAVLQKSDTPNKNGRIYPDHILKREIEKYQAIIKKGGALNELNHPSCHTGEVSLMTSDGWKNIKDIKDDEIIFTLSENGKIEVKQIYSKVTHKYEGKMIRLSGKNINTVVTPNHKFPIFSRKTKKMKFITASEILEKFKKNNSLSDFYIPKNSTLINEQLDEFIEIDKKYFEILTSSKIKGICLDNRTLSVNEEYFNDLVYSVDVPNHTYYIKSNGKCHWTGNSSLIDLDRVSHSVLETWWEGKILMGKIKLFTSPGWKKMGIVSTKGDQAAMLLINGAVLGISSRGVGSLSNVKGQNIVQEDFELVCFDLVSSPSTHGAYVFMDPSEREFYEEAEATNGNQYNKMKNLISNLDDFLKK